MIPTLVRNMSPRTEVALVIALFAGWFMFSSVVAVVAGFPKPELSDPALLYTIVFEIVILLISYSLLRARSWQISEFNVDPSWMQTILGVFLYAASIIAYFGLWDLFRDNAMEKTFLTEMIGSSRVSVPMAIVASCVNGAYEEFFLTGYLLRALQATGIGIAIGISSLVR